MATIEEGFASQPFEIKVSADGSYSGNVAEVWTEMFDDFKKSELEVEGDEIENPKFRTQVLHYATITELIQLRNEINTAIKELAGV